MSRLLERFIPSHIHHPFKLIGNMLSSGKRAAFFALWLTALGLLMIPVDFVLQWIENSRRRKHPVLPSQNTGPFVFVCGPARSGTTLVYQVLAQNQEFAYVRNFTTLFSRSPILASSLFTRENKADTRLSFENYYGKTAGLQGPSEANHLWNQWVDEDTSGFRTRMSQAKAQIMATFFRQFSATRKKPVLSKNNNANAFADSIAAQLDNSYFICLRRNTDFLAQSLIRARLEINGDIKQSYGVVEHDVEATNDADPVNQVLRQINYLNTLAEEQQQKIGKERFWIVDYEDFCADPDALVQRVQTEILNRPPTSHPQRKIDRIAHNNHEKDAALLQRIRQAQKTSA